MVTDPVCGMVIDPKTAAATSEYEGTTFYFCAVGCKKQFDRNPVLYLAQQDDAPAPADDRDGGSTD